MRRLAVAFAAAALAIVGPAEQPTAAQDPAGQTPAPQFRSSVDVVRLDVTVLDKDHRPVRGLGASDFTVLENGVPQAISAFTAVDVPDPVPDPAAAPWLREVAPDVLGNAEAPERRLFVMAIDDATIDGDPRAIGKVKEIARSVVDRLGPADRMSVVFTRDNRNSQDFTADRGRLFKAIDSFTVGFRGQDPTVKDDLWFLYSVSVLDRAVDFLADVSERRKAIIYVGQGLPFDISEAVGQVFADKNVEAGLTSDQATERRIKDQLTDMFDRAKRANVNIYTVDVCGLRVPFAPKCGPGLELDYLVNLAAATGGRPVVNSNDFDPGLTSVFVENSSYYLLGYQPADAARDGRFRKLQVKVDRPGVEVRTRSGYDAPRDVGGSRAPIASPLSKALAGVVPKGDLPMQVTAAPFAFAKKGGGGAALAVAVGLRQPIRQSAERTVENVDLQISAFDVDGKTWGNSRSRADVTIRAGASGEAQYEVFGQIDLKPGRYQVRVAAYVTSLETAGSVYFDVDVPDFAQAPLTMSGVLVSAKPSPVFAPKDGLKALVPVIPTTRRVFAPAYDVSAFARVYRGKQARFSAAAVRMTIRNSDDVVVIDRVQELGSGKFSGGAADLRFDLPVADLPAGRYLLTVEAEAGGAKVSRDSRFEVVR